MKYKQKYYYIKTFGCQANLVDSNTIAGILESVGFEELVFKKTFKNESEELSYVISKTDIFIVNTCSVRQKSEDKVYGMGKLFKSFKHKKKAPFVIMSGCVVGSATSERPRFKFSFLKKKTPWVNMYMNPGQIFILPDILVNNKIIDLQALKRFDRNLLEIPQAEKTHAYINISTGCDNFCTYCVVPFTRGAEISRSKEEILKEINNLTDRGFKYVTLCGQNVNSWGLSREEKFKIRTGSDQKLPFAQLLREISKYTKIEKIDFLSSNPFDFTNDLIEAIKDPKISNYFHIAIQSGSNEVLKKVNRRHKIKDFIRLINDIKKVRPDAEFGTDIIVGFPGETREQFMETVKLFQKVIFNVAFISIYSPRKGTAAEKSFKDDVALAEKKWRHRYLTHIWRASQKK